MSAKSMKIREYPEILESRKIEIFWPGDPACDLEASDLDAWAKSLGETGLVSRAGQELTPVRCRRLKPRELPVAERAFREEPRSGVALAASMGLLCIGDPKSAIRRARTVESFDVVPDDVLEPLLYHDDWNEDLPYFPFLQAVYVAMGIPVELDEKSGSARWRTSLASVVGAVVLARSFRVGRPPL